MMCLIQLQVVITPFHWTPSYLTDSTIDQRFEGIPASFNVLEDSTRQERDCAWENPKSRVSSGVSRGACISSLLRSRLSGCHATGERWNYSQFTTLHTTGILCTKVCLLLMYKWPAFGYRTWLQISQHTTLKSKTKTIHPFFRKVLNFWNIK